MSLEAFNVLLFVAGPLVVIGGVGKTAHWLVHSHASGYERDVRKVKGERPRPLPHQDRVAS
jgi:hypothetical protein